ncbi:MULTISPECIES: AAA family ATPase [Pseudomonas]|uniref:AAA family ATPase n=1 Tax=Pseudomonas TaxID=286 RepID=UPI001AE764B6|nr:MULTISPECIES: AAA family ATPase [unclassified Pseudomonas]MBP1085408.1 putative ATP-binding protein involved in virulence [Pseudomonas sp. PvP007]MBP1193555.1 putative ATP-binding protein involved in virulence [Pseudomonas sp. PvP100]
MGNFIESIIGNIESVKEPIHIKLQGKNLIITGRNGSGKTYFLKKIFTELDALKKTFGASSIDKLTWRLNMLQEQLHNSHFPPRSSTTSEIASIESELQARLGKLNIYNNLSNEEWSLIHEKKAVLILFEAERVANISHADGAKGLESTKNANQGFGFESRFGNDLEQHLVNMINRRSYAVANSEKSDIANSIDTWLANFDSNLKLLMEDESTALSFNPDTLKYTIKRDNKPTTDFQSLSSGYSAIFSIFSELLMRTEYFDITPNELRGVVFIDEIESHLHVSLQRLILPFFERSFPSIQFIITTHSPFVITSTTDSVIYDLTSNTCIQEDVSLYSYTSILEGLLGTPPRSLISDNRLSEIVGLLNEPDLNEDKLRFLLKQMQHSRLMLDKQVKAIHELGLNILQDKEQSDVQSNSTD